MTDTCIRTSVSLMMNIVETACEHESDLDLMRLVNFMDLYRTYLAYAMSPSVDSDAQGPIVSKPCSSVLEPRLGITDCASFEQFISDSRLLELAALAATHESGITVAIPAPLKLSANCNLN